MFKRKWHWTFAAVVVLCLGGITFLLKSKIETQEPIKVYKAVTPDPKPIPTKSSTVKTEVTTSHSHDHNDRHNHEHFHETGPHSHAEEKTISDSEYDWQDDGIFDSLLPKVDPWEQTYPEQETTYTDDTYPPRDWYKTKDPELHAEYFYAQLLKQFGDLPEVHTVGEYNLNVAKGVPQTLGKIEAYLEANYHLFPNEKNKKAIEDFQQIRASGAEVRSK